MQPQDSKESQGERNADDASLPTADDVEPF